MQYFSEYIILEAKVRVWSCFPYSLPAVFPVLLPQIDLGLCYDLTFPAELVTVRCSATWIHTFLLNKILASPLFSSLLQISTQTVTKS